METDDNKPSQSHGQITTSRAVNTQKSVKWGLAQPVWGNGFLKNVQLMGRWAQERQQSTAEPGIDVLQWPEPSSSAWPGRGANTTVPHADCGYILNDLCISRDLIYQGYGEGRKGPENSKNILHDTSFKMWTVFNKNENRVFAHISRREQGSSPEILALRLCLITLVKRIGKPDCFKKGHLQNLSVNAEGLKGIPVRLSPKGNDVKLGLFCDQQLRGDIPPQSPCSAFFKGRTLSWVDH